MLYVLSLQTHARQLIARLEVILSLSLSAGKVLFIANERVCLTINLGHLVTDISVTAIRKLQ
jgi:hypothetical protein